MEWTVIVAVFVFVLGFAYSIYDFTSQFTHTSDQKK
jgi:hypothetical protein